MSPEQEVLREKLRPGFERYLLDRGTKEYQFHRQSHHGQYVGWIEREFNVWCAAINMILRDEALIKAVPIIEKIDGEHMASNDWYKDRAAEVIRAAIGIEEKSE